VLALLDTGAAFSVVNGATRVAGDPRIEPMWVAGANGKPTAMAVAANLVRQRGWLKGRVCEREREERADETRRVGANATTNGAHGWAQVRDTVGDTTLNAAPPRLAWDVTTGYSTSCQYADGSTLSQVDVVVEPSSGLALKGVRPLVGDLPAVALLGLPPGTPAMILGLDALLTRPRLVLSTADMFLWL
jgi:hypothetical protein